MTTLARVKQVAKEELKDFLEDPYECPGQCKLFFKQLVRRNVHGMAGALTLAFGMATAVGLGAAAKDLVTGEPERAASTALISTAFFAPLTAAGGWGWNKTRKRWPGPGAGQPK